MFSKDNVSGARLRSRMFITAPLIVCTTIADAHSGDWDAYFGSDGAAQAYSSLATTTSLVIDQSNRKIFTGRGLPFGSMFIGAMNNDGRLDATFGASGFLTTSQFIADIKVDSKNRILLAQPDYTSSSTAVLLTRLLSDGSVDTSFGIGGYVNVDGPDDLFPVRLSVGANDAIYISAQETVAATTENLMVVAKVDAAGNVDSTYGTGGIAEIRTSTSGVEQTFSVDMSVDSSQRVASAGYSVLPDGSTVETVAMLTAAGTLDTSFGSGSGFIQSSIFSTTTSPTVTQLTSAVFDADDHLVTSVIANDLSGSPFGGATYISRYRSDGKIDPSFNLGNPLLLAPTGTPSSLSIDGRNRILVSEDDGLATIYRLNSDGSSDKTFGSSSGKMILTNLTSGHTTISHGGYITSFGQSVTGEPYIDQIVGYDLPPLMPPDHF